MTTAELIRSLANRIHIEEDSANLTGSLRDEIDSYYAAEEIDYFHKERLHKELRRHYRRITGEVFPETPPAPNQLFGDNFDDSLSGGVRLYYANDILALGDQLFEDAEMTAQYSPVFGTSYLVSEDRTFWLGIDGSGAIESINNEVMYKWNRFVDCDSIAPSDTIWIPTTDKPEEGPLVLENTGNNELVLCGAFSGGVSLSPEESPKYSLNVSAGSFVIDSTYCIPRFVHSFKIDMTNLGSLVGAINLYSVDEIIGVGSVLYTDEALENPYDPYNPDNNIYSHYLISIAEDYYVTLWVNEVLEVWTTIPQLAYITNCDLQNLGTNLLPIISGDIQVGDRVFLETYPGYTRTQLSGGTYFESNGNVPITNPGPHIPAGVYVDSNLIIQSVDPNPCYE